MMHFTLELATHIRQSGDPLIFELPSAEDLEAKLTAALPDRYLVQDIISWLSSQCAQKCQIKPTACRKSLHITKWFGHIKVEVNGAWYYLKISTFESKLSR